MPMARSMVSVLWERYKPDFWDATDLVGETGGLFNYRRIWMLVVGLVFSVAVIPLVIITVMDYNLNRKAMRAEFLYPMNSLLSNTSLSLSSFLRQRLAVLEFIVTGHSFVELSDEYYLHEIFDNMNSAFGGFVDLGLIDVRGMQQAYVGPYELEGMDYSEQDWFQDVLRQRVFISDVFLGFRDVPHFVMAVKKVCDNGNILVLRATIDTEQFARMIHSLNVRPTTDAFVVNMDGVLQTGSDFHGNVLDVLPYAMPGRSNAPEIKDVTDPHGNPAFLGYVHVDKTPFIFMVVKQQQEMMQYWWRLRWERIGFLVLSVTCILVAILTVATLLVRRVHGADMNRTIAVHKMEHTNKMASIGRLAAGVAHEINNPLAVINEKAGLLKDLFSYSDKYAKDEKLLGLADSILGSVERCSVITHRLLGFARHVDVQKEDVDVCEAVREVLGFLSKEAQYRDIDVRLEVQGDIPLITTDRGQLQQVLLNIVNNAFAAVHDGGHIFITVAPRGADHISLAISDDGCGIPPENVKRIFEPFFSTKAKQGTGLGLSITYGLVKKLNGSIDVHSEVDQGTTFTITLPVGHETTEEVKTHADSAG
jgi:two-component system, NtrC family, sensor kinase